MLGTLFYNCLPNGEAYGESKQKIKIEKDWFEKAGDAVILNQKFTGDKNGNISFT